MRSENPRTVYVIDPDNTVRASLRVLLDLVGFEVESFSNAEDFLSFPRAEGRACIVSEVDLPGLSGLELQELLKRERCDLPIIFITSSGGVAEAVRALRAGAADFLPKPFVDRFLLNRIEEVLPQDEDAVVERPAST